MTRPVRILKFAALALAVVLAGGLLWMLFSPPALLRVGAGYAAKMVCSNVFLNGRDPDDVLSVDVQAPGNPLLRLMQVDVDHSSGRVQAAFLGGLAGNEAVDRAGLGCTVLPQGGPPEDISITGAPAVDRPVESRWPEGKIAESDQSVAALLSDPAFTGDGMRALVVLRGGRIVAEAYGEGFSAESVLLGWSMTKTVNAAIIGTLINRNRMRMDETALLPQWQGDPRAEISLADLLAMEDGLAFNESYGSVTDVTQMLYLEPDMAAFAADAPLRAEPGARFSYSSGSAVLLSRIWMDRLGDAATALAYPREALFRPLGMDSAVMEVDAAGTFVGSSYMYATARDWARFALFLLRDGLWNGERLLPEGFVAMMAQPNGTSEGRYSQMQTWLPGPDETELPEDTFFLQGHDGQTIAVMPSLDLAVVRLGLTPRRTGYDVVPLVREIVKLSR
ncbi:MAG: serine hydrolase [Pseudorhizobium pelagicum]|uniref:serine hydrolase domain-containing protein n=1 Tax=Pseudorhizobium pelagicum TaxID=1509405 RepID=UPI003460D5CE